MKEKFVDAKGNTMEDYDRWGTPRGILKPVNITLENRKAVAEMNVPLETTAATGKKDTTQNIAVAKLLSGLTKEQGKELSSHMNACFGMTDPAAPKKKK